MIFEKGKSGVTFVCLPNSSEKLEKILMAISMARKYKTKADIWLGIGAVAGSPNIVDGIAFSKEPWHKDKEIGRASCRERV